MLLTLILLQPPHKSYFPYSLSSGIPNCSFLPWNFSLCCSFFLKRSPVSLPHQLTIILQIPAQLQLCRGGPPYIQISALIIHSHNPCNHLLFLQLLHIHLCDTLIKVICPPEILNSLILCMVLISAIPTRCVCINIHFVLKWFYCLMILHAAHIGALTKALHTFLQTFGVRLGQCVSYIHLWKAF